MPRIPAVDPKTAEGDAKSLLDGVRAKLGAVPNIFATMAQAPSALEGFLALNAALAQGALPAPLREQIALAVAGSNGCDYCASAHTALGKGAGLGRDELARNLDGRSADPKVQPALDFARNVVAKHGHVSDDEVAALRAAGFGDREIVEIVAHVAANIFTNYFNIVAGTEIDFPVVRTDPGGRAA
jgi:uncharacterized peroxidase-related enzyme